MRIALTLIVLACPAAAWEFSDSPVCTLTNNSDAGTLTVTYDAALPEYSITITLPRDIWPEEPQFAISFEGTAPIRIQTDRHERSANGHTLMVTDSGFGNVLNGLELNSRAYATSGETTVGVSLEGIRPAMEEFRNCPAKNVA